MMAVIGQFSPDQEVYSIDECFIGLDGFSHLDLMDYGKQICQRVFKWVGIPVCVGIAPTKTLAKLANHCAKKNHAGKDGICDLEHMTDCERSKIFAGIDVGEIWGVARKLSEQLTQRGIATVEDLRRSDPKILRREFSVLMERTVMELNGIPCHELEDVTPDKQQIMSSRSFGASVLDIEQLAEAVASYVAIAAEKLRGQGSLAGMIQVYVRTNPFKPDIPQYSRGLTVALSEASSDTLRLTRAALWGLKRIYRPGYEYQKAGIALLNLTDARSQQGSLFATCRDNPVLIKTMDRINSLWGRGTLRSAAEGTAKAWKMKRERMSPRYTTAWGELPRVRA